MELCGRESCEEPYDFTPSAAPPLQSSETEIAALEPDAAESLKRNYEEADLKACFHESGHAIYALICAVPVDSIQISGQPHCRRSGPLSAADYVGFALAGDVGVAIATGGVRPPAREDLDIYLTKAKTGCGGSCDGCKIGKAMLLVGGREADNDTLAALWRVHWRNTVNLFGTMVARDALITLARELHIKRRMTGYRSRHRF
jgi:hypothetical protein